MMIVAGEASGDAHAANLVRSIRAKFGDGSIEFWGATGPRMREAGVETVVNSDELSVVGIPEIARALPVFWKAFQSLKNEALRRRPDAVVLVDFPDFNFRLAKALKKAGLKVVYYISPQLWAWRKYRVRTIRRDVDLLLTILPFEKDWYAEQGIHHVEYVGHPLAGAVTAAYGRDEFCKKFGLDKGKPIVALLPGSRHKEIVRILPVLLETASQMAEKQPELQFVIALAGERNKGDVDAAIREAGTKNLKLPNVLVSVCGETREALAASNVAAVTSGTATLETAMIGTPMAIVYKSSLFNYVAMRPLIDVPHFGLINLIAEERLAKEMIQSDFSADALSAELFRLLEPGVKSEMRGKLKKAVDKLGGGGASDKAAEAILKEINLLA